MGYCSYILSVLTISCLYFSEVSTCSIDGIEATFADLNVRDIDRGVFFRATTTGITGIQSIQVNQDLVGGPYYNFALEDSELVISLAESFANYEEYETLEENGITVAFNCLQPNANLAVTFIISITDTNNNDPAFMPSSELTYTVTPPLPPGYFITDCTKSLQVRDIDLTTYGIDFEIEPNDFIEVAYDNSTTAKMFEGILKTKSFIRSLPEPLILWIKATDIDRTGDPPRTTTGTLRIEADAQFQFPDEPVFSRAFYLATYCEGAVLLEESVTLGQGYDDSVRFSVTSEYSEYFSLKQEGNSVTVEATELPSTITRLGQILLEMKAEKELTSGASATLVVRFPEDPALEFAETSYGGQIIDNSLNLPALLLSQGYESGYNVSIENDYAEYFTATQNSNQIIITMRLLTDEIIAENSFLTLRVIATNEASSAVAVVLLEVIKDDTETPVFASQIYTGNYDTTNGLSLVPIVLSQGYDSSVQFYKSGEYESLFTITPSGNSITLSLSSPLPEDILAQSHLLLTIGASKPRTVGAHTTVSITLPSARALSFEEASYTGSLEGSVLTLRTIRLTTGFADDVKFTLNGDYASSFSVENDENVVSVTLSTPISENVIENNNFLALTLEAKGANTLPAMASIVLDIIKDDTETPVFDKHIYYGTSLDTKEISLEDISLVQGYDNTVIFTLSGDDAQFFEFTEIENKVTLKLTSNIPADVVYEKKVLIFNIMAAKPRAVGANAAVSISFPSVLTEATVMKFSKHAYVGYYENNLISLEKAVLEDGFAENTSFVLSGEYASNFDLSITGNTVTLDVKVPLPANLADSLVVLELIAARDRAVTATASLVIDIVVEPVSLPIFDKAYYEGSYINEEFLFGDSVYLIEGFDETVTFTLEGELSEWFTLVPNGNEVTIALKGSIPEEILEHNSQLLFVVVANKPGTDGGRAVISINLTKECSGGFVRFARSHYVGRIASGSLEIEDFTLLGGGSYDNLNVTVSGEYSSFFNVDQWNETITLSLKGDLPNEAFSEPFIILEVEVSRPGSSIGLTTAILEITKDSTEIPIFENHYYTGSYSTDKQLVFEHTVQLIQGFDDTVEFTLEENIDASWFVLEGTGNSWTVFLKNDSIDVTGRSNLVFSILATKPGLLTGSATVVISIADVSSGTLRFTQQSYSGNIQSSELTLEAIKIEEGYTESLHFSLSGEYAEYFKVEDNKNEITVQFKTKFPSDVSQNSNILILTLRADSETDVAYATLVIEIKRDANGIAALVFQEAFYSGSYSEIDGLSFDQQIRLIDEFDDAVLFALEGDQNQWFEIQRNIDYITLTLKEQLPTEVLTNYRHLLLSIVATKENHLQGKAAIIISLDDDLTSPTVLRFEQNYYEGEFSSDKIILDSIRLSLGYNDNTKYTYKISGDLNEYFKIKTEGAVSTLELDTQIPEDLLENKKLILLELEVSATQSISAYTTIILKTDLEEGNLTHLIFEQPYYVGTYTVADKLNFENTISLAQGYNENVVFSLEEGYEEWFLLQRTRNGVALRLVNEIPSEILVNNRNLIFIITASLAGSQLATTSIVISLEDDVSTTTVLKFEQATYNGTITNNELNIETIVLSEGFSERVNFELNGDLKEYFSVLPQGQDVTLEIKIPIPENVLVNNRVIILEIKASGEAMIYATTGIVIEVIYENIPQNTLVFEKGYYTGRYTENQQLEFDSIIKLSEGYDETVSFTLEGELAAYFIISNTGTTVTLALTESLPDDAIQDQPFIVFELTASSQYALSASATIILTLASYTGVVAPVFSELYYAGKFTPNEGLNFETEISLRQGYDETVTFVLGKEGSRWFEIRENGNSVTLIPTADFLATELSDDILEFSVIANKPGTKPAEAGVFVLLQYETSTNGVSFEKTLYTGTITGGAVLHETIVITGFDGTNVEVLGEYGVLFEAQISEGTVIVQTTDLSSLPADISHVTLELVAGSARTILVIVIEADTPSDVYFEKPLYIGTYKDGLVEHEAMTVSGYEGTVINISGEYGELFSAEATSGVVLVRAAGSSTLPAGTTHVTLQLQADTATAVLVLTVQSDPKEVSFEKILYTGTYKEGEVNHETIKVSDYEGTVVTITGEYGELFSAEATSGVVMVRAAGSSTLPAGTTHVTLQLQADTATAVLVLTVQLETTPTEVSFSKTLYSGSYKDGIVTHENILVSGYNGNNIDVIGEAIIPAVTFSSASYEFCADVSQTGLVGRVQATADNQERITYSVVTDSETTPTEVSFSKTLYSGSYKDGIVTHENILVSGYNGNNIDVIGDLSSMFSAVTNAGAVVVQATGSLPLPAGTTHVALELAADPARAVLILDVIETEAIIPAVTFSSASYEFRADVSQTGLVGRVQATADNQERITYSVVTDSEHLQARLSVSSDGDLQLFAPVNSGIYSFSVSATTVTSQVSASAPVRLTVQAVTVCGDDLVVPPLIVLERDEEEPHEDLVVSDGPEFAGCRYTLTNRWPLNQNWLYVDDRGLHARAIDREDESIAFMALSQVQVELVLYCDNDSNQTSRSKRSLNRLDWLGPYDYGNNKWTLTESISFNSRRSFVNLIVNDINDNDPIFAEKANEPIAVGYPVPDLLDVILPRALTELTATDADIGENASLLYWSSAAELAVAPGSGAVHVRDNQRGLQDGATLTVHATDRDGQGNTGSIQLVVRLLTEEHIAVVTVRDSFLEDEESILKELKDALGYEVKVLNAVVISDQYDTEDNATEDARSQAVVARGASLQLYVYGLELRQPVEVERLTSDINSNLIASAVVADSVSLRDYLESREICSVVSGRDIGLLAATIVLSVFLFILIVAIVIWFYRKWRKNMNYDYFSDENSLPSRDDGDNVPKPDTRPRIDIEELKRSERKLQERLDAPVSSAAEGTSKKNPLDTRIDVPLPEVNVPIVIQSIDKLKRADGEDEDEFGEIKDKGRRKSVVTFNENVEKIIHVEDIDSLQYESIKL